MTVGNTKTIVQTFEEQYHALQETIGRLETGGVGLEESINLYELGVQLAASCEQLLASAELRVTRLSAAEVEGLAAT